MTAEQYYQCRLRCGDRERIGWVVARGAKVGNFVELLPSREFWHVAEVFSTGLDGDHVKELEARHRAGMPSTTAKVKGGASHGRS